MGTFFSEREFQQVETAESAFHSPIPTQVISNGEFNPPPQSQKQKQVEERIKELADLHGGKRGMDRRSFLKTSSGMAAAFLAMNEVYGNVFDVSEAEAAHHEAADERAARTSGQFIFDVQTHFVHDGYSNEGFLGFIKAGSEIWGSDIDAESLSLYNLKFENYVREIYLNSDTSVSVLSGAPFDDNTKDFLTNAAIAEAVQMVNATAGSTRMLGHAVVRVGQPGWMEEVDKALEERPPASWKLYTIGDPGAGPNTKYPFWLDDEDLIYPFYEKAVKAGINTMCIHKGLMPKDYETSWPDVWQYQTPRDLLKAAKDWPQINFVIYHGCLRPLMDIPGEPYKEFVETGRIEWASDLAEVPEKAGVNNVYAEMGTSFASTCVADPRFAAALLGTWIKGLGADNVVWGTDSVLHGSPQWQIEALRRLEIPEQMQEEYGFAALGGPNSAVKNKIFGYNSARLYNLELRADYPRFNEDKFAQIKDEYRARGELDTLRTNTSYGYIPRQTA